MFLADNEIVDVLYVQQLIIAQCHPLANTTPHGYSRSMNCQSNGASHKQQSARCSSDLSNPIRSAPVESVESQQDLRTGRTEVITSVQAKCHWAEI